MHCAPTPVNTASCRAAAHLLRHLVSSYVRLDALQALLRVKSPAQISQIPVVLITGQRLWGRQVCYACVSGVVAYPAAVRRYGPIPTLNIHATQNFKHKRLYFCKQNK